MRFETHARHVLDTGADGSSVIRPTVSGNRRSTTRRMESCDKLLPLEAVRRQNGSLRGFAFMEKDSNPISVGAGDTSVAGVGRLCIDEGQPKQRNLGCRQWAAENQYQQVTSYDANHVHDKTFQPSD